MLVIDHLTKTFGDKTAVDDLSLHIAPGEIYGFIGHNGAGKTTTIKACCGILRPDSGSIQIAGKDVARESIACKQSLAYIPDNPDLYEFLSGIRYLNFVADIFGVSQADRQERIRHYADLFDLTADLAQPRAPSQPVAKYATSAPASSFRLSPRNQSGRLHAGAFSK